MGPAAPVDPRRAPAHARARRRDGAAHQADHRLPPHRHGEDGRGAHLRPGVAPTSPAWTTCRRSTTSWCCRWPSRRCSGVEMPPRSDWIRMLMVELNRVSSHLMWMATNGMDHRVDVHDDLRLPRARDDPGLLREDHRPADEPQLHPARGHGRRPARRVGGRRRRSSATRSCPALDEYDELLTGQPIFRQRSEGVGNLSAEEALALSLTGPHPAVDRRALGPAPDHALPRATTRSTSTSSSAPTATTSTATRSASTRSASRSGSSARSSRRCRPATTGSRTRRSPRRRGAASTSRWRR